MKYNFRDKKGRWITKEIAVRRFAITLVVWIVAPLSLMLISDVLRGDSPEIVHHAQAVDIAPTTVVVPDVCLLDAVLCRNEKSKTELAIEQIPHESMETDNRIVYLYEQAPKRGINPDTVAHSIWCESSWWNVQSGYVYPDGEREDSWGLAQINLPNHPEITKEQALDPYWSIDWKLENWNTETWYGYSRATDTCTNGVSEYWHD